MAVTLKIRVVETVEQGRRMTALVIADPFLQAGALRARFRRWGHKQPYLHSPGWEVGECWIDLVASKTLSGELIVPLPPELSCHMEAYSNYEVTLEQVEGRRMEQAIRWSLAAPRPPLKDHGATGVIPAAPPSVSTATDQAAWRAAQELDSRQAYLGFFTAHPGSAHADAARQALTRLAQAALNGIAAEDDAWRVASAVGDKAAFTKFVLAYPEGRYAGRAKKQLEAFLPDQLVVRTGWSANGAVPSYGVDTCAFLLASEGVVRHDSDFISSWATDRITGAALQDSTCESVRYAGLAYDRANDRHIETLSLRLDQVAVEVEAIAITLSIDTRASARIDLRALNPVMEVEDTVRGKILATYEFGHEELSSKGLVAVMLMRCGADWLLKRSYDAIEDGIVGLCHRFGVVTE
jgi:stress response protein SCP2